MTRKLLMKKILPCILALTTTSALAHPGHITDESLHGFLHVEHIIALAALGVIALIIDVFRSR